MTISLGGKYKGNKLQGKKNYWIWKTISETDLKSKRVQKYLTRKAMYLVDLLSVKPSFLTNNLFSPLAEFQPNNDKDTKTRLIPQKDYKTESKQAKQ